MTINTTTKVTYYCPHCGSRDISWDAWAVWDMDEQEMVLGETFDFAQCKCGYSTNSNIQTAAILIDYPEGGTVPSGYRYQLTEDGGPSERFDTGTAALNALVKAIAESVPEPFTVEPEDDTPETDPENIYNSDSIRQSIEEDRK